jgi:hypothetical protein
MDTATEGDPIRTEETKRTSSYRIIVLRARIGVGNTGGSPIQAFIATPSEPVRPISTAIIRDSNSGAILAARSCCAQAAAGLKLYLTRWGGGRHNHC